MHRPREPHSPTVNLPKIPSLARHEQQSRGQPVKQLAGHVDICRCSVPATIFRPHHIPHMRRAAPRSPPVAVSRNVASHCRSCPQIFHVSDDAQLDHMVSKGRVARSNYMASREPVVTVDESSKRALWMTMLRIPNRWFSTGMILTQGVYIYILYVFFAEGCGG